MFVKKNEVSVEDVAKMISVGFFTSGVDISAESYDDLFGSDTMKYVPYDAFDRYSHEWISEEAEKYKDGVFSVLRNFPAHQISEEAVFSVSKKIALMPICVEEEAYLDVDGSLFVWKPFSNWSIEEVENKIEEDTSSVFEILRLYLFCEV